MAIKEAILWPWFKHIQRVRQPRWPKISKHAVSSWYWLLYLLVAMKLGCSEISILMRRGGVSCHCQGWFHAVSFVFGGIFSCGIMHSVESLQMCAYVYKPAFSWRICSNYNRAARCKNCYPSIISQLLWALHKRKPHTHTHTQLRWFSHTLEMSERFDYRVYPLFTFLHLPQWKPESLLDCILNQSNLIHIYFFRWVMTHTYGSDLGSSCGGTTG